jgi:hypothetical protein
MLLVVVAVSTVAKQVKKTNIPATNIILQVFIIFSFVAIMDWVQFLPVNNENHHYQSNSSIQVILQSEDCRI